MRRAELCPRCDQHLLPPGSQVSGFGSHGSQARGGTGEEASVGTYRASGLDSAHSLNSCVLAQATLPKGPSLCWGILGARHCGHGDTSGAGGAYLRETGRGPGCTASQSRQVRAHQRACTRVAPSMAGMDLGSCTNLSMNDVGLPELQRWPGADPGPQHHAHCSFHWSQGLLCTLAVWAGRGSLRRLGTGRVSVPVGSCGVCPAPPCPHWSFFSGF